MILNCCGIVLWMVLSVCWIPGAEADLMNSGMELTQCENGVCPAPAKNTAPRPNPAVARIIVTGDNSKSYGTGTLVTNDANHCFILTCAHLFENDRPRNIAVVFPDRSVYDVRILAIDRVWDLAILQNEAFLSAAGEELSVAGCQLSEILESGYRPLNTDNRKLTTGNSTAAIPLAKTTPRVGDVLYYAGYGSDGRYVVKKGRLEGFCTVREGTAAETLVIAGNARQGDSGGPIVNEKGELVGVLWGTDGRTVCGTYNGRIQQFVRAAVNENRFPAPATPQPAEETLTAAIFGVRRQADENSQRIEAIEKYLAGNPTPYVAPAPAKSPAWQPFQGIRDAAGQKAAEAAREKIGESVGDVKNQIDATIGGIKKDIDAQIGDLKKSLAEEAPQIITALGAKLDAVSIGLQNSVDAAIQKIVNALINIIYAVFISAVGGGLTCYFLPSLWKKWKNKHTEKKD